MVSELKAGLRSSFVQTRLDQLAGNGGDVLVIATANNDAVVVARDAAATDQSTAQWAFRNALGAVVHRFGDRCVVVVAACAPDPPDLLAVRWS